jgi:hypothetical protein
LREDGQQGQERAAGHLSITVYPYKLTQRELEARLEPGLTVLPGQYLRFATPEPIFGQVREVRALPPSSPGLMGGYRLMISLLYGTPSLHPQQAVLMSAAQMGHEIQRLQEPLAQPLRLSADFSAELSRLGPLTLIGGDDFVQKYDTLQLLMGAIHPYRRLIILDPLGIFAEEDGFAYWQAGRDVRLSVQAVGSKNFLDAFGELFAPSLREAALRVVADHLPPLHEFMGFQGLLDWYSALNAPLKNLIVQNCQMVAKSQVFADTLEQALDWRRTADQPVTVVNLSGLSEPWRGLFYREAMQSLLEQSGDEIVPVLIYPENYLPSLSQWIQKADESEFKLLMLASPYVSDALQQMANNRFWTETPGRLCLMGSLTLGLPLTIPMPNRTEPVAEGLAELPQAENAPRLASTPRPDDEPASGFSSFNRAVSDEAQAPPAPSQVLPDLQAADVPLHWLGETAGPLPLPQAEDHATNQATMASPEPDSEPPFVLESSDLQSDTDEDPAQLPPVELSEAIEPPTPHPIVDLAAPPPEPAPEFLSAFQLSELLTSTPATPAAEPLPPVKPVSFSEDDEAAKKPDFENSKLAEPLSTPAGESLPSADQLVIPSPSVAPALTDTAAVAPQQPTETINGPEASEPFEFPLFDSSPPVSPLPESVSPPVEIPVMPPFPTPEEYEKEEFHFELNPDDHLDFSPVAPISPAPGPIDSQNSVSQSLDNFASLDLTMPEQPLDFLTDQNLSPVVMTGNDAASSAHSPSPSEIQEALDTIFPHQFEVTSDDVMPAVVADTPTAIQADEPMAIVQKAMEPSVTDSILFHAGDRVIHPTYGMGVVQKVIPMEESIVLNITFDAVGKRLLDPALCELTRQALK